MNPALFVACAYELPNPGRCSQTYRRRLERLMPRTALAILMIFLVLAFGWRSWFQWRRTGSTGFRGISGAPGSAEWLGGLLFVVALAAAALAPLAQLLNVLDPLPALDRAAFRGAGLLLGLGGMLTTLWSQYAMGDAWRIGVDEREKTRLVVDGPFRRVRNPIFTSMGLAVTGLGLMVPNLLAAVAVATLLVALQLQVRRVEEPYLMRAHGCEYAAYAARTGRFLPGIGRLGGSAPASLNGP
jgi:protein-S-isoprenylcysteine O-methyltransferase Ste14